VHEEDVAIHLNSVLDKPHNALLIYPTVVLSVQMIAVVMECVNPLILQVPPLREHASVLQPILDQIVLLLFVMSIMTAADAVLIPIVDGVAKLQHVLLATMLPLVPQIRALLAILGYITPVIAIIIVLLVEANVRVVNAPVLQEKEVMIAHGSMVVMAHSMLLVLPDH